MRPSIVAAGLLMSLLLTGCRHTSAGSMVDVWVDHNLHREWTLRVDRKDQLPSRNGHVRHMRWQHAAAPVLPRDVERALRSPEDHRLGLVR